MAVIILAWLVASTLTAGYIGKGYYTTEFYEGCLLLWFSLLWPIYWVLYAIGLIVQPILQRRRDRKWREDYARMLAGREEAMKK